MYIKSGNLIIVYYSPIFPKRSNKNVDKVSSSSLQKKSAPISLSCPHSNSHKKTKSHSGRKSQICGFTVKRMPELTTRSATQISPGQTITPLNALSILVIERSKIREVRHDKLHDTVKIVTTNQTISILER